MTEEQIILLMAAHIAAVRTVSFESRDFQGMTSPRIAAQISNSLVLARLLLARAKRDAEDVAVTVRRS